MRKKIEFIGEDSGGFKVLEGTLILHSDLLRGSFEISNNNCNLDNEIHLMDSKSCELRKHENGKYILSPFKIPSGIMYLPQICLLYTSPSPRDGLLSRMPSSA